MIDHSQQKQSHILIVSVEAKDQVEGSVSMVSSELADRYINARTHREATEEEIQKWKAKTEAGRRDYEKQKYALENQHAAALTKALAALGLKPQQPKEKENASGNTAS
jgi:hypothetical protein